MLTERQIGQIQGLRNRGVSVSETARIVGCCRAVVRKYTDLAQSPRKEYTRPMTPKRQRRLKLLKKLSREKCSKGGRAWPRYGSAQQLQRALQAKHQIRISRRQVHEDLVELGLRSYVRPECPTRRTKDVERRRKFARKELRRPRTSALVFTDESWLTCNENTGRFQWTSQRSKVLPRERRARWNIASVMVWAAFGHNYRSELVVFPAKRDDNGVKKPFRLDAKSYVKRCLSKVVPDLLARNMTLVQDGARSHAAGSTIAYLKRKKVKFIEGFPPYSPDLNMIEPLWKTLAERVGQMCPMTVEELTIAAKKVWNELPVELLNRHAAHFPKALAKAAV